MGSLRGRAFFLILLTVFVAGGCRKPSRTTSTRASVGASEAAHAFFEAMLRQEWDTAYELLDDESRTWCSKEDFTARGRAVLGQLDFTPAAVFVDVSEKGDHASALAVFRSAAGAGAKQFKDGADLTRTQNGWRLSLRKNFGVPSGRNKN